MPLIKTFHLSIQGYYISFRSWCWNLTQSQRKETGINTLTTKNNLEDDKECKINKFFCYSIVNLVKKKHFLHVYILYKPVLTENVFIDSKSMSAHQDHVRMGDHAMTWLTPIPAHVSLASRTVNATQTSTTVRISHVLDWTQNVEI